MTTYCNKSYVDMASLSLKISYSDPPLLAINGFISPVPGDALLKSPYRLRVFWHKTMPSIKTHFLFMSSTYKFNAFSILTKHLRGTPAVIFAV